MQPFMTKNVMEVMICKLLITLSNNIHFITINCCATPTKLFPASVNIPQ